MSKEQIERLEVVGIDVSAKTLAIARRDRQGCVVTTEVANTATEHHKLAKQCQRSGARVCLEATGVYHLDVARALQQTDGVEVMVVNPRAARDFTRAYGHRSKTDATDAEALLAFAERMPWQPWTPPSATIFELRSICRHAVSVRKTLAADKARLARTEAASALGAVVQQDIRASIEHGERRVEALQQACLDVIAVDQALSAAFALLCTIPGVGPVSAVQLLSELAVLPADMTAKQWTAHAGLDVREHRSGTSIDKAPRISRAGNAYLRRALFMPALVALQHSPQVKAYFERLVARGKPKMKAVVAVMRKLLHAIWGMLRSQSVWDGERFCATVEVTEAVASRLPEPPAERRLPIAHASAEPARADAGKGARGSGGADQPQRRGQRATRPLPGSSTVAC
ncbi:MAG: IS110 family transposase [Candidatus Nanopelagicales bacterium]